MGWKDAATGTALLGALGRSHWIPFVGDSLVCRDGLLDVLERQMQRLIRFDRKMKRVPENGSCRSCSHTSAARLSAPRRSKGRFPRNGIGVVVELSCAASTITRANTGPPSSGGAPFAGRRVACRQPNSCCGVSACRRATADTDSPLS
jgi:hypothetical protein